MTEGPLYAGLALLLTVYFVISARRHERTSFPPSSLFVAALLIHAFIDFDRLVQSGQINPVTESDVRLYSLGYLACTLVGYRLYFFVAGRRRTRQQPPLTKRLFTDRGVVALQCVGIGLLAISVSVALSGGVFYQGKGDNAYESEVGVIRFMLMGYQVIPAIILALIIQASAGGGHKSHLVAWGIFGIILLMSVATYSRGLVAASVVMSGLYWHYRVHRFRAVHILCAGVIVALISAAATVRTRAIGSGEIGLSGFVEVAASNVAADPTLLLGVVGALPGQEVFSQVLNLVPEHYEFRYGATYFLSGISLLLPRALDFGGLYNDVETPAFWFKRAFAPDARGQGFDFSMFAEAYLNFGPYSPLLFMLVGAGVARASMRILFSIEPVEVYSGLVFVVGMSLGLRSDSNTVFKTWAYSILVVTIVRRMSAVSILSASRRGAWPAVGQRVEH